jgi:glycosyltransferase involved in cell wall biosynthesis
VSALDPVAVHIVLEPERVAARPVDDDVRRLEVIQPSESEEEYQVLDGAGRLVHRISAERAYLPRMLPGLRASFALRALERLLELRWLWNRRFVSVSPAGTLDGTPAILRRLVAPEAGAATPLPEASGPVRSVEVVCCTYRRPEAFPRLLPRLERAFAAARARGLEVGLAVVCQEDTLPRAWIEADPRLSELPWLRFVRSAPGLPRARNAAVAESRAEVVLFVDDDVDPSSELVIGHVEALNGAPRAVGSAGRVDSRIEGIRERAHRAVGQVRASGWVDTNFDAPVGPEQLVVQTPLGANMAFRRERMLALLGTQWFDATLEGVAHREETTTAVDLDRRGEWLVYAPEGRLFHEEHEVGGCENRGSVSRESTRRRRAQEQRFLRRFYASLGPFSGLAAAVSVAREVRRAPSAGERAEVLTDHLAAWLRLSRDG